MNMKGVLVAFVLINLSILASCGAPRKVIDVPFWNNYEPSWSSHHIKYLNGGTTAELLLDKSSGKQEYFFWYRFSLFISLLFLVYLKKHT